MPPTRERRGQSPREKAPREKGTVTTEREGDSHRLSEKGTVVSPEGARRGQSPSLRSSRSAPPGEKGTVVSPVVSAGEGDSHFLFAFSLSESGKGREFIWLRKPLKCR